MKFVADENLDRQIVEKLRREGHTVWYVADMDPGIADPEVLDTANREQAILLTADKDFGELVYRQRLISPGVILIRLAGLPPPVKAEIVAKAITAHSQALADSFTVITERNIRIRHRQG